MARPTSDRFYEECCRGQGQRRNLSGVLATNRRRSQRAYSIHHTKYADTKHLDRNVEMDIEVADKKPCTGRKTGQVAERIEANSC